MLSLTTDLHVGQSNIELSFLIIYIQLLQQFLCPQGINALIFEEL
jgi:hypothetical protein